MLNNGGANKFLCPFVLSVSFKMSKQGVLRQANNVFVLNHCLECKMFGTCCSSADKNTVLSLWAVGQLGPGHLSFILVEPRMTGAAE